MKSSIVHPLILCATTALLMTSTACDEFATPAELSRSQILAIRADPPGVAPGQTALLDILVADQDGAVAAPDVTWEAIARVPDTPPLGEVDVDADGRPMFVAPTDIPEDPSVAAISAQVTVDDITLSGLKLVVIGSVPLANPTLSSIRIDDRDAAGMSTMTLAPGQTVPLEVAFETNPGATPAFGWYSTVGEIERYQSNPTELIVQDAAGDGWVIVVVRDGMGGAVWTQIHITVE